MNIIQLVKGSGKSFIAVLSALKKNYPIITSDQRLKSNLLDLAKRFPKGDNLIVLTLDEWKTDPKILNQYEGVIIDDLDLILSNLLGKDPDNIIVTSR